MNIDVSDGWLVVKELQIHALIPTCPVSTCQLPPSLSRHDRKGEIITVAAFVVRRERVTSELMVEPSEKLLKAPLVGLALLLLTNVISRPDCNPPSIWPFSAILAPLWEELRREPITGLAGSKSRLRHRETRSLPVGPVRRRARCLRLGQPNVRKTS